MIRFDQLTTFFLTDYWLIGYGVWKVCVGPFFQGKSREIGQNCAVWFLISWLCVSVFIIVDEIFCSIQSTSTLEPSIDIFLKLGSFFKGFFLTSILWILHSYFNNYLSIYLLTRLSNILPVFIILTFTFEEKCFEFIYFNRGIYVGTQVLMRSVNTYLIFYLFETLFVVPNLLKFNYSEIYRYLTNT